MTPRPEMQQLQPRHSTLSSSSFLLDNNPDTPSSTTTTSSSSSELTLKASSPPDDEQQQSLRLRTPPRSLGSGCFDLEQQNQQHIISFSPIKNDSNNIRQRTNMKVTQLQQSRRKKRRATSGGSNNQQYNRPPSSSSATNTAALAYYRNIIRKKYFQPTFVLPMLVLIDMFAVSLVVPLLFQYYKSAGVTNASQRELLSSLFSISQIIGGLSCGVLTDAKLLKRKTILLLSFGGSAISYALIVISYAVGGLYAILLSRVLVGLVKQTMTVATAMVTNATTSTTRAKHMGRLKASTTVAWIVGPSSGALLYKHVDVRFPALLACGLFVLNFLLAAVLLDDDDNDDDTNTNSKNTVTASQQQQQQDDSESGGCTNGEEEKETSIINNTRRRRRGLAVIISNIRSCFTSKILGAVIMTRLIIGWVSRSTSYAQLGSFYEDMYGLEPHHRGYISSYQQLLKFIVNMVLIGPVLSRAGGERYAICYGTAIMAIATWLESQQSLPLFLAVLCPLISLSVTVTDVSIQSLVTHVAPAESIFSVLAALDVLQNAVSVSVPFYRTLLFRLFKADSSKVHVTMEGDPDPVKWVRVGAIHYGIAALLASYLLLSCTNTAADPSSPQSQKKKKKGR